MEPLRIEFVTSDLSIDDPCSIRGFIDQVGVAGIEGWAVDLSQTDRPVTLHLAVEDVVVAETVTNLLRPDLSVAVKEEPAAGFFFGPRQIDCLREFLPVLPQGRIRVVAEGTGLCLEASAAPPTLAAMFGTSLAGTSPWTPAFNLLTQLSTLQAAAIDLAARPLRPETHREQGYVEAMAVDDGDNIWLIGWMARPIATVMPAIVVDRQKLPAALALICYDRDDVAAPACGFVGILQTAWQPSTLSKPHIYLGDTADGHLGTVRPLKLISTSEFGTLVTPLLARCHAGPIGAIRSLLSRPETWVVKGNGDWSATGAALDNCLTLPGFGALVEGWVLSPVKRIAGLALKIGPTILSCDLSDVYWRNRQDLAASNPGRQALLDRAGFVAVFRGNLEIGHLTSATLKILYEDGSSSNHPVASAAVGRIGHSDDIESALAIYPHLPSENFFAHFGAALRAEFHAKSRLVVPKHVRTCERAIILTLPAATNDLLMVASQLAQYLGSLAKNIGLVFIASQSESLPLASATFDDIQEMIEAPCSLFCVQTMDHSLYALPAILAAVRADRFAFVAASVLLTRNGWHAISARLASEANGISLFGVTDIASVDDACEFSARCFAWNRGAFLPWMRNRPFQFGGVPELPTPSIDDDAVQRFPNSAVYVDRTSNTRLTGLINKLAEPA